jgi:CMP-N-acetylneuraminic acid synthetase
MLEAEKLAGKRYDVICDLDATAPLRNEEDIRGSVQLLLDNDCSNVLSGMLARRSPYYNLLEVNEGGYIIFSKTLPKTVIRRQDAPPCFDANSSIYVWHRESLLESPFVVREKTMMYIMPEERSLDIDSELDFKIVQYLMEHHFAEKDAPGATNPV